MSKYLSDRFSALQAYVPGEQPRDRQYIKLNTNESPYPPSPGVEKVINSEAIADLRLYGDPSCSDLKAALAEHFQVQTENIFVGNGSDEVLSFAFMAFCDNKTGVSYPDISYGFYFVYADLYNLDRREVPLRENFSIAPEDYFNAGTTVVIANPNAPTGLCLPVGDIESIVRANPDNVVVIDEAYIDFGGESAVSLVGKYKNLLVVQTCSKSRSLAGSRLGFAVGSSELIADLEKLRYSTNPFNINRLTLLAGVAAIKEQAYYDSNNQKIIQTRDNAANKFRDMGFYVSESKANFLFAKHSGLKGRAVYEGLKERGILVRHFAKPRIDEYVRITVGTPEQMEVLCGALEEMIKNAQCKN